MISKIVHTGDWHLKVYDDHDKFLSAFDAFEKSVDEKIGHLAREESLVIVAGDLFNNRNKEPSNISFNIMLKCIKRLTNKYNVLIFIGNHDYDVNNKETLDCISPIATAYELFNDDSLTFLKESCCIVKDNIIFAHYSNFEDNKRPNIEAYRSKYPDKTVIGLFHDVIQGALNHYDYDISKNHHNTPTVDIFEGCDFAIMGDIHKHQVLKYNHDRNKAVYCGSLFQLNYGETVTGHGYCLWDVDSQNFEFIELDIDYGMYKLVIDSIETYTENTKIVNI